MAVSLSLKTTVVGTADWQMRGKQEALLNHGDNQRKGKVDVGKSKKEGGWGVGGVGENKTQGGNY